MQRLLVPGLLILGIALGAWISPPAHADGVDSSVVAAVVEYGRANLDERSGLVKDGTKQANVAESSPGYLAALLIQGNHDNAVRALLSAILANQDMTEGSDTRGYFRWYADGNSSYSYDATLYALPVLAWCLANHRAEIADQAGAFEAGIRAAIDAINDYSFEPHQEAYLMLQTAACASAGGALGDQKLIDRAEDSVTDWLKLVRTQGLPEGHSPAFDAMRLAALYWLQDSLAEHSPDVDSAIRLCRADAQLRMWPAHSVLGGAAFRSFMSDYMAGGGLSGYMTRGYFGIGELGSVEPFVMHFLLPAPAAGVPVMPTEPLTLRTSSTVPDGIAGTCTYTTPEFSLGTMTGRLGGSSLPLVARFADEDYPQAIVATVHPTDGYVSSLQHNGMALCAIHFDRIGFGTRKQAYISLRLGHRDQIDEVLVRGAAWNQKDTGIGQREALILSVADCYVGLMIGRCGPVEGDTLRRVKPGELRWAGAGKLERLQLDIYGRRSDFTVRQPLNDVRVTLAACVVPASAYASVEEFADAFKQARISEEVEQIVVSLKEESELPDRKPLDGLIPDPKPKKDMPRKRVLQQTITWKVMDAEFELVEDLYAAALLSSTVDDVEVRSESLWSAPGFSYPADTDLDAALAAGGY